MTDKKTVTITTKLKDELSKSIDKMISKINRDFSRLATGPVRSFSGLLSKLIRQGLKLSGILGVVGAALSVGGIVVGIRRTASEVAKLALQAEALGLTTPALFEVGNAVEALGASATEAFAAIATGRENLLRFQRTGAGPATETVRRLNLSLTDANGEFRSMDDLITDLARGFSRLDEFDRLRLGRELFGTNAPRVLGVLTGAVGELEEVRANIRSVTGEITQDQVEQLSSLDRSVRTFGLSYSTLFRRLTAEVAPAAKRIVDLGTSIVAALPEAFGRLVDNVDALFGDDSELRLAVVKKFSGLERSLVTVVRRVAFVVGDAAAQFGIAALNAAFTAIFKNAGQDVAIGLINTIGEAIAAAEEATANRIFGAPEKFETRVRESLRRVAAQTRDGLAELNEQVALDGAGSVFVDFATEFDKALVEVTVSSGGVARAVGDVGRQIEGLTGIVGGARKVLGRLVTDLSDGLGGPTADRALGFFASIKELAGGVVDGIASVAAKFKETREIGLAFGVGIANSFSQNLFPALESVVDRTKSVGDAFKDLARSVARSIAEIATQILALRIITGIGSFFSSAAAPTPGLGDPSLVGASGELLAGPPIANFARGGASIANAARGFVQGPLQGGRRINIGEGGRSEGVLPLFTGRNGMLGVQAEYSGGGGGVTIAPTINVTVEGDARNARGLAENITDEVVGRIIELMRRTPAFRQQLTAMPAGTI